MDLPVPRHGASWRRRVTKIAALFAVATGEAVGLQQEKVKRGVQNYRKLSTLVSAIESEIEKRKSEQ